MCCWQMRKAVIPLISSDYFGCLNIIVDVARSPLKRFLLGTLMHSCSIAQDVWGEKNLSHHLILLPHFVPQNISRSRSPPSSNSRHVLYLYILVSPRNDLAFLGGRSHKNFSHFWGHTRVGFSRFATLSCPFSLGRDMSIPKKSVLRS